MHEHSSSHAEHRLIFLIENMPSVPPDALPEQSKVIKGTIKALESVKQTIAPSQVVDSVLEGGVKTLGALVNPMLVAGVIGAGMYMVMTGEAPEWLKKLSPNNKS